MVLIGNTLDLYSWIRGSIPRRSSKYYFGLLFLIKRAQLDSIPFIYNNKKNMNKCLQCGKEVKNKFCNTSCQNKYQKRKFTPEQYKKSQITKFGEFRNFTVVCHKCEKEFEVTEREKLHPQKEKYYCSRSCANSHNLTEESKLKISTSIKKLIENGNAPGFLSNEYRLTLVIKGKLTKSIKNKIPKPIKVRILYKKNCPCCEKEFESKNLEQKYCSRDCKNQHYIKIMLNKWLNGEHNGMRGKTSTAYWIKKYMIKKYGEKCMDCNWSERNKYSKKIPIELEHIDGDFTNNKEENLKLLCPNCHSLTSTYKGGNKKQGRPRSKYYRGC